MRNLQKNVTQLAYVQNVMMIIDLNFDLLPSSAPRRAAPRHKDAFRFSSNVMMIIDLNLDLCPSTLPPRHAAPQRRISFLIERDDDN